MPDAAAIVHPRRTLIVKPREAYLGTKGCGGRNEREGGHVGARHLAIIHSTERA